MSEFGILIRLDAPYEGTYRACSLECFSEAF